MKLFEMNKQFELYKIILNVYRTKIEKLESKQEKLNRREQDILTIKDNTPQILQLLLEQQQKPKNLQSLKRKSKTHIEREIQNKRNKA